MIFLETAIPFLFWLYGQAHTTTLMTAKSAPYCFYVVGADYQGYACQDSPIGLELAPRFALAGESPHAD